MLYETPRVQLKTKLLIKAMRLVPLVAAGELDALAASTATEFLCLLHKRAPDAIATSVATDDKGCDAAQVARGVEHRDQVDAYEPEDAARTLRHPRLVRRSVCKVVDVGTNSRFRHGVAQLGKERHKRRSVLYGRCAKLD